MSATIPKTLMQSMSLNHRAVNHRAVNHRNWERTVQTKALKSMCALAKVLQSSGRPARSAAIGLTVGVALGTAGLLGCPAGSQAALLRYTASGTGISGSLAGNPFSDASWQVFANADPATALHLFIPPGPTPQIEAWLLRPVSPTLQLDWAGGQQTAQLGASSPFSWSILSGTFPPMGPSPKIGFVYAKPDFSTEHAAGLVSIPRGSNPSLFNNLQAPVDLMSLFGTFEASTYPTDLGDLIISSATVQPGRFLISPVPGPLPVVGVGMALGWSRQLRRRCQRPSRSHRSVDLGSLRHECRGHAVIQARSTSVNNPSHSNDVV